MMLFNTLSTLACHRLVLALLCILVSHFISFVWLHSQLHMLLIRGLIRSDLCEIFDPLAWGSFHSDYLSILRFIDSSFYGSFLIASGGLFEYLSATVDFIMLIQCLVIIILNLGIVLLILSLMTLDEEAYEAPESFLFGLGIVENGRLSLWQISFLSSLRGLLRLYYSIFSLLWLQSLAFFLETFFWGFWCRCLRQLYCW